MLQGSWPLIGGKWLSFRNRRDLFFSRTVVEILSPGTSGRIRPSMLLGSAIRRCLEWVKKTAKNDKEREEKKNEDRHDQERKCTTAEGRSNAPARNPSGRAYGRRAAVRRL